MTSSRGKDVFFCKWVDVQLRKRLIGNKNTKNSPVCSVVNWKADATTRPSVCCFAN